LAPTLAVASDGDGDRDGDCDRDRDGDFALATGAYGAIVTGGSAGGDIVPCFEQVHVVIQLSNSHAVDDRHPAVAYPLAYNKSILISGNIANDNDK
jgi:hypothetical protein